ncbi:MAG: acetate--CoA ligase [Candidatus Pacearchaeota archaeon]|jgi:acetyl-CoA synthetase|nr:acetate--CoA ligase [Candidatus Pacearchaeota archaeon]MDP7521117.1 acetate--CoA ligase [Candidatus Pacearchaeota archaeon]|tara:strand:- start:11592 stop:13523 length:1932 start_codon:yes stop_codon:yes gene_type:complete
MVNYIIKKSGKFLPSKEMKKIAWIKDKKIYKEAEKNPIKFWGKLAREGLKWEKPWKKTYEEKPPYFYWFKGGKLNFCVNVLDRHLDNPNKTALIWVPEPTNEKTIKLTYKELYDKVNRFANVLKKLGVKKGDVVAIYLPMIPEVLIAMLACTRIGAIHSVVFSAFSADALKIRLLDGKTKILIGADGYYRRGKKEDLKKKVDKAIIGTKVKKVIMVNRFNKNKNYSGKFVSFEKEIKKADLYCKPVIMNSEDPLFILYTSGTTGKPKGIVHDIGGYATYAYWTTKWSFNLHENDVLWCTADIGWITGHTYTFYGPLLNGSTSLIYEGTPDYPNYSRWWKIIDKNNIAVFYTAPTAIRMFMKAGEKFLRKHKLNTLKILGTVGEPIDKNAWEWYFKKIGKSRCPIIDTWWQTETGGTLINVLPGIGPFIPTVAGYSFPGTKHIVVDEKGKRVKEGKTGFLVQLSPYAPGMLHGIYKDNKKYKETYFKKFKNKYDTSDGAYIRDGLIRVTGRTDDVMKVAGHRISTAELEDAINKYKLVNESAVVPIPDKIKGQVPIAFVVLKSKSNLKIEILEKQIKQEVDKTLGPTSRIAKVYFVNDLPKTRSGKIMRRILKNVLNKEELKGLITLVNPNSVEAIKKIVENNK